MSLYNIALFAHIIGVIGMFMAVAVELVILLRIRRVQTVEQVHEWTSADAPLEAIFPIMTLLLLAGGVYMVFSRWSWSVAWIDVSLVGLILMSILGPAINSRRLKALHHATTKASRGPLSMEITRQVNDPVLWTSIFTMTMVSLGIVFLMTVKPDLIGTIITMVVALVLGVLIGQVLSRPQTTVVAQEIKG